MHNQFIPDILGICGRKMLRLPHPSIKHCQKCMVNHIMSCSCSAKSCSLSNFCCSKAGMMLWPNIFVAICKIVTQNNQYLYIIIYLHINSVISFTKIKRIYCFTKFLKMLRLACLHLSCFLWILLLSFEKSWNSCCVWLCWIRHVPAYLMLLLASKRTIHLITFIRYIINYISWSWNIWVFYNFRFLNMVTSSFSFHTFISN